MRKLILMLLLAFASTNAMAEWVAVDKGGGQVTTYADLATIRKNGNKVKMWNLVDFKTSQVVDGFKPFLSLKLQDEYDCKKERSRILAYSWLSGNMGNGDVVWFNSDPLKWGPVEPDSANEGLWKIACGKQ